MAEVTVSNPKPQQQAPRGPILWNVMVRHSPFPLKNANVEAMDEAEAKAKFLELAKAENEKKCQQVLDHQESGELMKAIKARRASFDRAVEAAKDNKLEFIIRPAKKVEAERKELQDARARTWGSPERMAV